MTDVLLESSCLNIVAYHLGCETSHLHTIKESKRWRLGHSSDMKTYRSADCLLAGRCYCCQPDSGTVSRTALVPYAVQHCAVLCFHHLSLLPSKLALKIDILLHCCSWIALQALRHLKKFSESTHKMPSWLRVSTDTSTHRHFSGQPYSNHVNLIRDRLESCIWWF